jgi:hypothetical protein
MIAVQFPEPAFNIRKEGEKRFIFDNIRKSWLLLTAEEWVRQNFLAYLVKVMSYPESLIAIEKEIFLNGLKKRFDVLVYDKVHRPWMLVECKAPSVALNEAVLQQALRYHQTLPVQYIIITNGEATAGWGKRDGVLHLLTGLPAIG